MGEIRMKKIGKNALALFLAGVMALMPAGESLAVEPVEDDISVVVIEENESLELETESVGTEKGNIDEAGTTEIETQTGPETEIETETETEVETRTGIEAETGTETEAETGTETEIETETETEIETETETEIETETETEIETGTETGTETEIETGTETGTETEIETETETKIETETETEAETESAPETEDEFPGLRNSALSSEQLADKADLLSHLSEIENLAEGKDYAAGELVFLADTEEEAKKIAAAYGGELARYQYGVGVVALPDNVTVVEAVKAATSSATERGTVLPPAWPNYIYRTCEETGEYSEINGFNIDEMSIMDSSDNIYTDEKAYTVASLGYNDPFLSQKNLYYQWQHAMVGSVTAWNAGYTGQGIKIAILDTGITTEAGVTADLTLAGSFDMTGSASGANDLDGHGTHVAGLAAAKANNNLFGAGIAPDASVIAIKVLGDDGNGKSDWIMAGINKAVSEKADIINMSLGSNVYSGTYATVVKNAYKKGVVIFAAASNDGSKAKAFPAAYDGVFAVGAVQQNKGRTYFSNYGSWVKFSAPGDELPSLPIPGTAGVPEAAVMSGTSQATPVVSGTAAVILSADETIRSKTNEERVKALISKMNKGKIAGNGGAAGIVSIPKALGIPVSSATPNAPVIEQKSQTVIGESFSVSIKPASLTDVIYYSLDGKNPTYKNGKLSTNAEKYNGVITVGGKSKVVVKAIAINACGKVSKVATATYTFKPLVSAVTISGQNTLVKGKSTTLKAVIMPDYAANKSVLWTSSDPEEVKVSGKGKVTATAKAVDGKVYTITATSKDEAKKAATFKITVKATARVKKIEFKDSEGRIKKNDTIVRGANDTSYDLTGMIQVTTNTGETEGSVKDVILESSNANVAAFEDIKSPGILTIKGAGKTVITAMAADGSGLKATFTLTVKQNITEITVKGTSQISNGKSASMQAVVNSDASSKGVIWSVAPENNGVTIDRKGKVKAAKNATAGTYKVTATANDESGVSGFKEIEVSDNAIAAIALSDGNETVKKATIFRVAGSYASPTTIDLTASITAKTADGQIVDSNAFEFSSSNPGIADVIRVNGKTATISATGRATGTTTISCKATDGSGKKATCKVTVLNPASNLTITPPAGNGGYVGAGKTIKMTAAFEEEFGTVSNKKVEWYSDNPAIAEVNEKTGVVKGKTAGKTATIFAAATDGSGVVATYSVSVCVPIQSLILADYLGTINPSRYYLSLDEGVGGYSWEVRYNDKKPTNSHSANNDNEVFPLVSIEVADPNILSASWGEYANEIVLWPIKNGTTKVTFKAMDGSGTKVTYVVSVANMS